MLAVLHVFGTIFVIFTAILLGFGWKYLSWQCVSVRLSNIMKNLHVLTQNKGSIVHTRA